MSIKAKLQQLENRLKPDKYKSAVKEMLQRVEYYDELTAEEREIYARYWNYKDAEDYERLPRVFEDCAPHEKLELKPKGYDRRKPDFSAIDAINWNDADDMIADVVNAIDEKYSDTFKEIDSQLAEKLSEFEKGSNL